MTEPTARTHAAAPFDLRVTILLSACLLLGAVFLYAYVAIAEAQAIGLIRAGLRDAARLAASGTDPSWLSAASPVAPAEAHVRRIQEHLGLPDGSVGLLSQDGGQLRQVTPPARDAGAVHPEIEAARKVAFDARVVEVSSPYAAGALMSAIAPVLGPGGEVAGYLQIEISLATRLEPYRRTLRRWATGAGTALGLAVLLIFSLVARLTAPMDRVSRLVAGVAQGGGDLTKRLPVTGRDVAGRLAASFNEFVAFLEQLLGRVVVSARAVAASTKRLQQASQTQVEAAAEQAAVIGKTTRTLQDLVRTFQSTSQRANDVVREAREAMAVADEGVGRLGETVTEMERVKATSVETIQEIYGLVERSHEIGQVMALINDVAAKTKLIAFNAAIEASAAGGDTGRRFSVVAQEVRRLAERVVKSTGQIEGIIRDIQARVDKLILRTEENYRKVERGFEAAEEARGAIRRIAAGVERTSEAAVAIGVTARAQVSSGDLLLGSLTEMDDATHAFRESILEMKSTSDELDRLFVDLLSRIRRFRVGDGV